VGGGNYSRLKRGEVIGGVTVVAPWRKRSRGRHPWHGGVDGERGDARLTR
jgi:hypothetical protein